jgi:hypothetical protein
MNLRFAYRFIAPAALVYCLCLLGCNNLYPALKTSAAAGANPGPSTQPPGLNTPDSNKVNPLALLPGSGPKQILDMAGLQQLGLIYMNASIDHPPKNVDDLDIKNTPKYYNAVKEGGVILYWNVNITQLPAGSSNTILGYVYDVPTKGGAVLMADGSARRMTVEEFNKTAKAGK